MKKEEFKKLIKEAVKEAIKEELVSSLVEVLPTQKSPISSNAEKLGLKESIRSKMPKPDFKFTTVQVSVGAGSTDDKIYLTSVDKLCIGMSLTTIQSGSVSGSPTITEINTVSKYVKVSVAQTWADTKNITFTGNGNKMAFNALGLKFSIPNDVGFVATLVPFTGTLNGAISNSNALVMDSVFGVRADGTVTFTGIGIDNSSDNFVTSINYSTKTLEVTTNQTLEDDTIITFRGCARQCTLQTSIVVTKMPAENVTLTLDLDSILTSSTT